jgi:hypothetical protein
MKKYYFPPVGFGFWYQFGVLNKIKNKNYQIYGSSAGSIICLINILKPKDRELRNIIFIISKIRSKYKYNVNLYNYILDFIKQVFIIIQYYDDKYILNKLDNTFIEVSQIHTFYNLPYKISSSFIKPKNLLHLKDLVIASCFVPFATIYNYNPLFYKIDNKFYFDGFFGSFSNHKNLIKINSYEYGTLVPKSNNYFIRIYNEGQNYNFNQKSKSFTIISFIQITINIFMDFAIKIIDFFYKLMSNIKIYI